ncbi:hypothetical protein BABINDRAFT_6597 [Babjeviella inositovora NRRL Y-12698]|uniref:Uncharacterized protein n=1 Tax=Babjeviella inositovora NRRL Y-12698 TaxID=984486 RepID=A0A1E3QWE1_9ASCO|nr:uncharacterized protein BABINDRAFT_6597 [Babjeviella inositovora NRRL Y-12698]ODQ81976.1 hypothetical protein BABINDRAFT_6597 [Babjeviella inositovora NRRL Y-12698]
MSVEVGSLGPTAVIGETEIVAVKKYLIAHKATDAELCAHITQLFLPIYNSLQAASGLSKYRINVCDTLAIWFLRAGQILHANPSQKPSFKALLDPVVVDYLFHYVIDFFNTSGAALGNSLKEMFSKLVALLKDVRDADARTRVLRAWIDFAITKVSITSRALYFMVEVLSREIDAAYILTAYPTFVNFAMSVMSTGSLLSTCARAITAIYKSLLQAMLAAASHTDAERAWLELWQDTVIHNLHDLRLRRNLQIYLLPLLFKLSHASYRGFIRGLGATLDLTRDSDIDLLLGCVRIGQDLAIVEEPFDGDALISIEYMKTLLVHQTTDFRIGAFAVLTASAKGSKSVKNNVYDVLREVIAGFFLETDASFRDRFQSLLRAFIARVRDSCYSMNRDIARMQKGRAKMNAALVDARIAELTLSIDTGKRFLTWLADTAYAQMRPGTSFQRLDSGFKVITALLKSGLDNRVDRKFFEKNHLDYPFSVDLYSHAAARLLIDNVTNEFQAVREHAIQVLFMWPRPLLTTHVSARAVRDLCTGSFGMLAAIRGRNADSGARILQFVFSLTQDNALLVELIDALLSAVAFAKRDFARAAYTESVHGYYNAISVLLEGFGFAEDPILDPKLDQLVASMFEIWEVTQPLMAHESPEGNLPAAFQQNLLPELEAKYGPAEQVVLSYAWRAVKESSNLMRVMLARAPARLMGAWVVKSGAMIVQQLLVIRHPGAFSSVYPTFIACCARCNGDVALRAQPERWLRESLASIQTTSSYITRRSGGIPFIVTGVLTAETDRNRPLLTRTFAELIAIADVPVDAAKEEKNDIPQVHAFNCINHIFVESALGDACAAHVDAALTLALPRFASQNWSMRNCAVMLFTALQNRLFGSDKVGACLTKVPARKFFSRFKAVRATLLAQLAASVEGGLDTTRTIETVFPILTILSRLEAVSGYDGMADFVPWLHRCLANPQWKVREMAARAYPAVIAPEAVSRTCVAILEEASTKDQNGLHGSILAVQELIKNSIRSYDTAPDARLVQTTYAQLPRFLLSNSCWSTAKAYVNLVSLINSSVMELKLSETFVSVLGHFFLSQHFPSSFLDGPKMSLLADTAAVLLAHYLATQNAALGDFIALALRSDFHEVQTTAIEFVSDNICEISMATRLDIVSALWELLSGDVWSYVQAQALQLLQRLLTDAGLASRERVSVLIGFTADHLSEDVRSTALEAMGPFVGRLCLEGDNKVFERWMGLVVEYSKDSKPYQVRLAALQSLIAFAKVCEGATSAQCFASYVSLVHFSLYLFLSDEDEDIRNTAATSVASLFRLSFTPIPRFVQDAFVARYVITFGDSALEALQAHHATAVSMTLRKFQRTLHPDEALFSTEKENFYRNDLDQRAEGNTMLRRVASASALLPSVEIETTQMLNLVRGLQRDGFAGWAKDEDAFSGIMEVLCDLALVKQLDRVLYDALFSSRVEEFRCLAIKHELHNLIIDAVHELQS